MPTMLSRSRKRRKYNTFSQRVFFNEGLEKEKKGIEKKYNRKVKK